MNEIAYLHSKDLKEYVKKQDKIVIYGAGMMGQALYWLLKLYCLEDKVAGFALSPHATQFLNDFEGKKIQCFDRYDEKESTYIVAVKQEFLNPIIGYLRDRKFVCVSVNTIKDLFSDVIDQVNPAVRAGLNKTELTVEQYVSACIKQVRRKKLGFCINLVDHCNLNCQSCNRFCPIADKYVLPVDAFKKDMERIAYLTDSDIEHLDLIGGEPMLNPDLIEIMYAARDIFPQAPIVLNTNGTLIPGQPDTFFRALRDTGVRPIITKYPINVDYDEIDKRLEKEGIDYSYTSSSTDTVKTTYHLPLVENSDMDPMQNYLKCWHANECVALCDGRIYTCPIAPYAHYFNKYFQKNLYVGEENSISIYDVENIQEILEFLKKPIPFCRHCDISGYTFDIPWAVSKKKIEEWT